MYPALPIFITLCTIGLSTASNSKCKLYTVHELFLNKFPIPKETLNPININTKNVTHLNYSPLCIKADIDEKLTLKNTGKSIEEFKINSETKSHLTGGILRTCKYLLHKLYFLWTDNENGTCGSTIDGKGYPIQAVIYNFNINYKTFEEAIHHRDGVVSLVIPVTVGCEPNKDFDCFAEKLKQVQKAGYTTSTTLGDSIKWFISPQANTTYYAFPGVYEDYSEDNHKYFSNTIIYFKNTPPRSISSKQFYETFQCLKNDYGKSYTNTGKLQPARQIVVEAKGFNLKTIDS